MPKIKVNGKFVSFGESLKYGLEPTIEGSDLIVCLELESKEPVTIEISNMK